MQLLDVQDIRTPVQLFVVDLRAQLHNVPNLEIIDVQFDVVEEQVFVLTNLQHVIRIGFKPADSDLLGNIGEQA